MRLGIAGGISHSSAEEWAEKQVKLGCAAVVFPVGYQSADHVIDAYHKACTDHGLIIAEVGAWCNPLSADPEERKKNVEYIKNQLRLADRVGARCCVDIAGTSGERWDGAYIDNYSEDMYKRIIETVQEIIDSAEPSNTFYSLETMPWMIPDSPEIYAKIIKDVGRDRFAAHLDVANLINSPERYFFNGALMEKCFDLLGGKIRSCHAKDVLLEAPMTLHLKETACGNGGLDIAEYAALADKSDRDMPFIIEHLATEDEYVNSVNYIKNLLKDTNILITL